MNSCFNQQESKLKSFLLRLISPPNTKHNLQYDQTNNALRSSDQNALASNEFVILDRIYLLKCGRLVQRRAQSPVHVERVLETSEYRCHAGLHLQSYTPTDKIATHKSAPKPDNTTSSDYRRGNISRPPETYPTQGRRWPRSPWIEQTHSGPDRNRHRQPRAGPPPCGERSRGGVRGDGGDGRRRPRGSGKIESWSGRSGGGRGGLAWRRPSARKEEGAGSGSWWGLWSAG
jgi:hypothetical protein